MAEVIDLRAPHPPDGPLEAHAVLQAILASARDAVIVTDAHGVVELMNPAAERLFGLEAQDAVGRAIGTLFGGPLRAFPDRWLLEHTREQGNGGAGLYPELTVRRRDGSEAPVEMSVSEVRAGDRDLVVCIARDIDHRKRVEQDLRRRASTDPLTDVLNRASLHRALAGSMMRVDAGHELALLFIDLDGFKEVNDTLGHPAGDHVLAIAARRIQHAVRRHDVVGRYGGDEFVVVIEDEEDVEREVAAVSARIRNAFTTPFAVNDHQRVIDISLGVAIHPRDGATISQLVEHADRAMYAEKRFKSANSR